MYKYTLISIRQQVERNLIKRIKNDNKKTDKESVKNHFHLYSLFNC